MLNEWMDGWMDEYIGQSTSSPGQVATELPVQGGTTLLKPVAKRPHA